MRLVLSETGWLQPSGLTRADRSARARFGEYDVPKTNTWDREPDSNEAVVPLVPQRSDSTVRYLGGHVIDQPDALAGNQRGIHEQKSAVSAHHVSGSH